MLYEGPEFFRAIMGFFGVVRVFWGYNVVDIFLISISKFLFSQYYIHINKQVHTAQYLNTFLLERIIVNNFNNWSKEYKM